MTDREEKSPRESTASFTTLVLPEDTNTYGNLFGGRLLEMLDKVASIVAIRHSRRGVVTASMEHIDFLSGAKEGFIICINGRPTRLDKRSVSDTTVTW